MSQPPAPRSDYISRMTWIWCGGRKILPIRSAASAGGCVACTDLLLKT